jgi:hypothetical protein
MSVQDKLAQLPQSKSEKIANLGGKTYNFADNDLDSQSYTDTGDGYVENNGNKIWGVSEEYTPQEMAFTRDYALKNYSRPSSSKGDRRFYEFGVTEAGRTSPNGEPVYEGYDPRKIGLASGKFDTSDPRYTPGMVPSDWLAGLFGVDVANKHQDSNLDYNAATALEALVHSRNFDNRVIRQRKDGYYDYAGPNGMQVISPEQKQELFGSGASEYYVNHESIFAEDYDPKKLDRERLIANFENARSQISDKSAAQGFLPVLEKGSDFIGSLANAAQGFGATFLSELVINPVDAVGDYTGLYDIGTEEQKTQFANDLTGYDPAAQHEAMEKIGAQFDIMMDSNASDADRMKAAGKGILEAFTTPEMLGTSLGAIMAWFGPGKFIKAFGVGSNYDKMATMYDIQAKTGKITAAAARSQKLKAFASVDGAKSLLVGQSGMVSAAIGNVNNQYDQFLENNNGQEPEQGKGAWFAGRFAVQMINQNLDTITAFNIVKSKGAISALGSAVKDMTQKEFSNAATAMGKGVMKTTVNMGQEAAQEYSQTMMEVFNSGFGSEAFNDVPTFMEFITDKRNTREAGIAALAGAGGAGQFELVGALTGQAGRGIAAAAGTLGNKIKDAKPPTPDTFIADVVVEEETTPEQQAAQTADSNKSANATVGKYTGMFGADEFTRTFVASGIEEEDSVDTPTLKANLAKDPTSYRVAHDEIERAENVIEAREGTDAAKETDGDALKVLHKAKRVVYEGIMENEEHPTLGAGFSPEDTIIGYYNTFEQVDGELVVTVKEEQIAKQYAKDNDIPDLRFKNLRSFRGNKDASVVQEEALGRGFRSASEHQNTLRALVNSANPSKKAVATAIDGINTFLSSQENRKDAYDSVLNVVRSDIKNYNTKHKAKADDVSMVAESRRLKKGFKVEGYDKAFIAVSDAPGGFLKVNEESLATSASMKDTIDYLSRIKTRYGSQVDSILGEKVIGNDSGITVRPFAQKQQSRDKDTAFYQKIGATKVITDEGNTSPQWSKNGDYLKDNHSIVNTGEYTSDDVVVINSTRKNIEHSEKVGKELAKARNAKATVVIDNGVNQNPVIGRLLKKYHFEPVTEEGKGTRYLHQDVAGPLNAKLKEVSDKKVAKKTVERNLVFAMDLKTRLGNKSIQQAVIDGDITAKQAERYDERIKAGNTEFGNNQKSISAYYTRIIKEKSEAFADVLFNKALEHGVDSKDVSEAITLVNEGVTAANRIPDSAVDKGIALFQERAKKMGEGETLLKEWNEQAKSAKKGKTSFSGWVKTKVTAPMQIAKSMLDNSISKGRAPSYAYYSKKDSKYYIRNDEGEVNSEDGTYQVLQLDPSTYVEISRVTPLNTLNARELRIAGNTDIAFNTLVEESLILLEGSLRKPNPSFKKENDSITDFSDSPVATLIFDKDLKINENMAIAMNLALHNFIRNSGYLLQKGKKSKQDIAQILGIDESQISRAAVAMMDDKGLLYKTASNSIGKEVAEMMGFARKGYNEVDAQAYNALLADLGQTALLMGMQKGILERDNSLDAAEFAKVVLQKNTYDSDGNVGGAKNKTPKVLFIQAVANKGEELDLMADMAKKISESIPDIDVSRKEPSFKPLSAERVKELTEEVHKEKLGLTQPAKSKEAMTELMNTEWRPDLKVMRSLGSAENRDFLKTRLGFIAEDSDAYKELSYEGKDTQLSLNRGVEKTLDELDWLLGEAEGEDTLPMYFEYFFSKNGRFFIDSNTINPQTDKLLRFLVQPASHNNEFTYDKGKFTSGGKDVTKNVHYAIAQAFGFKTDKKHTAEIKEFAQAILTDLNSEDAIANARKGLLEHGEYTLTTKKGKAIRPYTTNFNPTSVKKQQRSTASKKVESTLGSIVSVVTKQASTSGVKSTGSSSTSTATTYTVSYGNGLSLDLFFEGGSISLKAGTSLPKGISDISVLVGTGYLLENSSPVEADSEIVLEAEHLSHSWQALDFLDKVAGKGKFTSALTAEFDAVTSGFGLKMLQMPIIKNIYEWLARVGVVKNNDPLLKSMGSLPSMNDLLASGDIKDSYVKLAGDITVLEFDQMLNNTGKNSAVGDTVYNRNLWEALSDALPKKDVDGVVEDALRSLFKYPFMTFNYSASIKTIRENLLTGELLTQMAEQMSAIDLSSNDLKVQELKTKALMEAFVTGSDTSIAVLQERIRTKALYMVKTGSAGKDGKTPGVSMERYLKEMIEASYGVQVEEILTEQFKEFVEAQEKVNDAFKAMFEVFSIGFDNKLEAARKKGFVSVEAEKAIYTALLAEAPIIKGPLSEMLEDGIGIYGLETSSPYGIRSGRKPVRAKLSEGLEKKLGQKDIRVSQMLKELSAAVAAGSVVPIHYIDGAAMGETINSLANPKDGGKAVKGITAIHDAIMVSLVDMDAGQLAYNEQTMKISAEYSFIDETMKTLERFTDGSINLNDPKFKSRTVSLGHDKETLSVRDFVFRARNRFAVLANTVNANRLGLYKELNDGAHIMHMAGTPEGVFKAEPKFLDGPIKNLEAIKPYKTNAKFQANPAQKQQMSDVNKTATVKICK